MKRSILSPADAAWLTRTITRNRDLFGGARMMADDAGDGKADDAADKAGDDKATDDTTGGDKPLGEGGKKALEAERQARKDAQKQVETLRTEFDGFRSALTDALGIKTNGDDKGEDALTAVQEQLAAMQRESSVLRLANEHRITDQHDLELLATAKDADSMKRLAERLAPSDEQHDATSRTRPKSDRSQGSDSSRDKQSGGRSVAQVMADRAAERAAKK